jgi:hypothetical protein
MEVLVNLGEVPLLKRSRFLGLFIKPLLDALVVVNRLFLRAHHVAPLYQSGVRYQQEPPDGKPGGIRGDSDGFESRMGRLR